MLAERERQREQRRKEREAAKSATAPRPPTRIRRRCCRCAKRPPRRSSTPPSAAPTTRTSPAPSPSSARNRPSHQFLSVTGFENYELPGFDLLDVRRIRRSPGGEPRGTALHPAHHHRDAQGLRHRGDRRRHHPRARPSPATRSIRPPACAFPASRSWRRTSPAPPAPSASTSSPRSPARTPSASRSPTTRRSPCRCTNCCTTRNSAPPRRRSRSPSARTSMARPSSATSPPCRTASWPAPPVPASPSASTRSSPRCSSSSARTNCASSWSTPRWWKCRCTTGCRTSSCRSSPIPRKPWPPSSGWSTRWKNATASSPRSACGISTASTPARVRKAAEVAGAEEVARTGSPRRPTRRLEAIAAGPGIRRTRPRRRDLEEEEIFEETNPRPFPLHRRAHRRAGRPHADRAGGRGNVHRPHRPEGPRRRHPPHHRHPDAAGGRGHRHHQGEHPVPHRLPGFLRPRLPRHPRHQGRGQTRRQGRHALSAARLRQTRARPGCLRHRCRDRAHHRPLRQAGETEVRDRHPGLHQQRRTTTTRTTTFPKPTRISS